MATLAPRYRIVSPGISSESIQDKPLTDAQKTQEEALQLARRLEKEELARERMREGCKSESVQPEKPQLPASDKEVAAVRSTLTPSESGLCEALRANTETVRVVMDNLSLNREGIHWQGKAVVTEIADDRR